MIRKLNGYTFIEILVICVFMIIISVVIYSAFTKDNYGLTDANNGYKRLSQMGYTHIIMTGYDVFNGCPDKYMYATGFNAVSSAGYKVLGVVCSDNFNNYLIQLK